MGGNGLGTVGLVPLRASPTTLTAGTWPRADAVLVAQEISGFGALGAPAGLGLLLAAPTIAGPWARRSKSTSYVRDIVTGRKGVVPAVQRTSGRFPTSPVCRPGRCGTGDEWVINGQKVWGPRAASFADLGHVCWPRTDPRSTEARRYLLFRLRHAPRRSRRATAERDGPDMPSSTRSFLTDAAGGPISALIGGLNKRLGRREHDPHETSAPAWARAAEKGRVGPVTRPSLARSLGTLERRAGRLRRGQVEGAIGWGRTKRR